MPHFPELNLPPVQLKIENNKVFDIFRNKWVELTPEEWVRQNFLNFLVQVHHYPKGLMSVEKQIQLHKVKKRYDAVVFNKEMNPVVLIEFKSFRVPISQETVDQAIRYNQQFGVDYLILSNGFNHFIIHIDYNNNTCSYLQNVNQMKIN